MDKQPSIRLFPTKHPFVDNKDGSKSNVKISTYQFDDDHILIPTMVEGKQLSDDEAISVAKKFGLHMYPKFKSAEEANKYAEQIHSNINESGFLLK